jgi:hypothetical protein
MSTTLALPPTSAHRIHEIDTPLIPATQVIARLGSHPTITVPMVAGAAPDADGIWSFLQESADFFDVDARSGCSARRAQPIRRRDPRT